MKETAQQKRDISKLKIGPCEKSQFQGKSVSDQSPGDKDKILLQPLQIKYENFVTDVNKLGFERFRENYPKISDAKSKVGIIIGPQIREIINDLNEQLLTENEKSVWLKFRAVFINFLGKIKAENYKEPFLFYFNTCTVNFLLFVIQPTKAQIIIYKNYYDPPYFDSKCVILSSAAIVLM